MELSVIIPTHARPAKLRACVRALAAQTLAPERYEVLVGLDGPDPPGTASSAEAAREAWEEAGEERPGVGAWRGRPNLRVIACPKQGLNATRNRLLAEARGRVMVSMNDDVLATPGLLEAHRRAQAEGGGRVVISGYSPFLAVAGATVFDDAVARTGLIFFYDAMMDAAGVPVDPDPARDWGFRHCWGLNFSASLDAVRDSGGFLSFENQYGYDDIEVAHRLKRLLGAPVLFRPEARADHDHRYTPAEVLQREFRLGVSAWHFAAVAPEFARAVFGRDVRSGDEVAQAERGAAMTAELREIERDVLASGTRAAAGDDADRTAIARALVERLRPLKRWIWRRGLLHAASGWPAYAPGQEPEAS